MARTLDDIQRQIEKLQIQAANIKTKEVAGVIQRIKVAIASYGLTPQDLFEGKLKTEKNVKATATGRVKKAVKKSASVIKFRDDAGHAWSGHGRKPGWFIQALESGKTAQDLAVKS
jgi:DNA-binding protein H-NS